MTEPGFELGGGVVWWDALHIVCKNMKKNVKLKLDVVLDFA